MKIKIETKQELANLIVSLNENYENFNDKYDYSTITDMSNMFSGYHSLKTIPELEISNVTNMKDIIKDCKSLEKKPDFYFKGLLIKSDSNNPYLESFKTFARELEKTKEENKINNTSNNEVSNEVSIDSLLKLNEKNKELLKESAIAKEDSKLSNLNSNNNNNEKENTKKEEVRTSTHKQR
jgi:hypothetical protein